MPTDEMSPLQPDARRASSITLDADTASVPVARRFVRRTLGPVADAHDDPAAAAVVADMELVSSELVTNAIEHGDGPSVHLAVGCDDGRVTVEVTSRGNTDEVGPAEEWQIADIESITGRGLGIVRELSDDVTVERRADQLRISVGRRLPAA